MKTILVFFAFLITVNLTAQGNNKDTTSTVPQSLTIGLNASPTTKLYGFGIRYMYVEMQVSSDLKYDKMPSYFDYSIPHSDYRLATYNQGLLYIAGIGHYDFTNYFGVNAGIGYYKMTDSVLAISKSTGWAYAYGSNTRLQGVSFIGGINIYPVKFLDVQIQYDTYKKLTLALNYRISLK